MGKTLGYGEITVANMTEPFTVMLTNEAQQFATDSNRKVTSAQSYYTDIIVIRGSQERTDYTIGNITSGSGITVSKSSKRVTFNVSAGTTIGADTGVIEIPITLDGQTVKKQFSWSCGKQGPQGVKGTDGNSFAWNMLSETNCGKKHWGTVSSGGKYSVESETTEDNIEAVKLICTESVSSSGWSYTCFTDLEMLKQLKPSTKYTLSYDIKANRSGMISHTICRGDITNSCTNTVVVSNIIENETWQHISVVLTTNDLKTTPTNEVVYLGRTALSKVGYAIIKNLKLAEGDVDTPWSPSQSDIEGKGIAQIVQYYLATSQASGVTSSTSGWSTDITAQKITATKKYLWNCSQTKYTDGTSEPITTPTIIGVYGDTGVSTKILTTSYSYNQSDIDKYSKSGYSGTWGVGISTNGLKVGDNVLLKVKNTTKNSDCLIFAQITKLVSEYQVMCTSYGAIDNGADGQDGAGFHWNLLSGTKDLDKSKITFYSKATIEPTKYLDFTVVKATALASSYSDILKWHDVLTPTPNTTYTLSFYAKASVETYCRSHFYPSCTVKNVSNYETTTASDGGVRTKLSTEWNRYSVTWTTSSSVSGAKSIVPIRLEHGNTADGATVYLCGIKLEQSDKPSPWCTTYEETLAKNLSITPSSQYFKSTDGGKTFAPNTITIKPTIQGEINFGKWQYSIDGGVSFADVVSGQKGLTISNNVLTVSKDSSLYSDAVTMITFRAVADDSSFYDTCSIAKIYDVSDIGDGRNLLWNSNFAKTDEAITGTTNSWGLHTRGTNLVASIDTSTKHNGFNTLKTVSAANGDKNSSNDLEWFAWGISERTSDNLHSKNQNYTLSFYAKASVTTDFIVRWGYDAYGADTTRTLTTNWQKYEIKLHQATSAYSITIIFKLLTAGTVWFSEFKLEKGSSATGYSTAPEDLQTAILSTKSEISDVSLEVDNNKQAIEQRVEKTTYQQDLKLVKGAISKANEGLNKWRYEIYPKSLFASEYQGKSTMDVFAKNTNLTPSQSVLINDMDLSIAWNYDNNYIGYALTFAKFSAAKSVAITFAHDDGAHIYLNGKLIGGSDAYSQTGESLTLDFVKGWNCIEVVVNEGASTEGFKLGTTISAISECQLMNCYYGTPVARQSHITNQLVENTTNIEGVTTTMQKVMTTVGGSDRIDEFVNNYNKTIESEKQFKKTIGETYTTKDDFNGLEIGGRNLLLYSQTIRAHKDYYGVGWLTDEVETFNGCPVWSVKNQWGRLTWLFKSHVIDRGLVKVGDTLTYSLYAKTNNASGKSINCSYRFKGNTNAYWFNGSAFNVGTNWTRYSVTFTITKDMLATDTYMTEIGFEETASMSGDDKVYYACPKLERGTKATDYTPALEDNEINGQNLVSNLSSNWEQGSVSYVANSTYASIKTVLATRLRTEDVFSVSGNVTISAGTSTNSSKEELNFYYVLFDVNKKAIGVPASGSEWQSLTSPKIINCGDAKYMAIILRWGSGSTVITPSNISQICLKIERGTSATPFTLAPEDVNGKIVNVETIANQTAKKFEWIVKGGDSSSNFTLTDRVADLVAERINFKGLVTFSGLNTDAKNEIGKVAQSKVDGLEVGGRNLLRNSGKFLLSGATTGADHSTGTWRFAGSSTMTKSHVEISDPPKSCQGVTGAFQAVGSHPTTSPDGECIGMDGFPYFDEEIGSDVVFSGWARVVGGGDNCYFGFSSYMITFSDGKLLNNYNCIKLNTDGSWTRIVIHGKTTKKVDNIYCGFLTGTESVTVQACGLKLEKGNKATDWTPAPEDVSQDATNKASQALTDAKNYSSNAVKWVTNNGSSTTSLNSMVKKWTDGAVSDTTQINGGWIKANTITASKIAVGDFTNYCQLNKDTASSYGFTATDDTKGIWFTASPIDRDKDISQWFTCEGSQKLYVEYDLSTTVKGKVNASDTGTSYLTSGIMIFAANGTKEIISYTRSKGVTATSDGTVTHISLVETLPADARFFRVVLQTDGKRNTFSGTLKIRDPQVRKATTGKLIVDGSITADKIATDAIKSRNYISSGCTQGSFLNLSDGSFTSPNLSWDSNGNLIAKNANIIGNLTAGTVGEWKIDKYIYSKDKVFFDINKHNGQSIYNKNSTNNLFLGDGKVSSFYWFTTQNNTFIIENGNSPQYATGPAGISFGTNIAQGQIELYESVFPGKIIPDYETTSHTSELSISGSKISFSYYDSNGSSFSDSPYTYIMADYARFYGDIFVQGSITTDEGVDVGGKLQASSIAAKNGGLIETSGTIYGGGEIQCGGGQMRIIGGDYGILLRNDGSDFYILSTDSGSPWGSWNSKRPFRINLANGIPYFEYGIIIPNENYLLGNGYQMCRGTSWGGVCIGDDSKGLRFYGTSIWASHSISTSDENLKENFTTLDQYEDFYMNLNPIGFNYIGDYDGKKTHFGFGAHKTEDILESEGYDSDKFAVITHRPLVQEDIEKRFGKDVEVDIETEYGISYTEFIALNTHMIQKTRRELTKVKQEKANLESRLVELEEKFAKLNL